MSWELPLQPRRSRCQDLSAESTVSGSVSAGNEAAVYAALQAEILTVDVEMGDAVAEGDVLCTLDVSTYQDNLSTLQPTIRQLSPATRARKPSLKSS